VAALEPVRGLRGISSRGQVTRSRVTAVPDHRTILGLMWWRTYDTSLPGAGRGPFAFYSRSGYWRASFTPKQVRATSCATTVLS
jgi:hypothetical protein